MIDNNGNQGVVDLIETKTTMLLIKKRKDMFYRFKAENKRLA